MSATEDTITIQASLSPVYVTDGNITHYQVSSSPDFPALHGEREKVSVNSDMVIGPDMVHLEQETKYLIFFGSWLVDSEYCPDGVTSGSGSGYNLCTGCWNRSIIGMQH